ncbi:hypothetical protein V5799_016144 [Amblyomma americanum]|uniref:C2H2-type domain-containing protein n=1 Tax=Amblyomma americanum TaxID=6943 RepID=A0AAQ4F604_AMBAM
MNSLDQKASSSHFVEQTSEGPKLRYHILKWDARLSSRVSPSNQQIALLGWTHKSGSKTSDTAMFACGLCPYTSNTSLDMKRHEKIHRQLWHPLRCGTMEFFTKYDYLKHRRIQHGFRYVSGVKLGNVVPIIQHLIGRAAAAASYADALDGSDG